MYREGWGTHGLETGGPLAKVRKCTGTKGEGGGTPPPKAGVIDRYTFSLVKKLIYWLKLYSCCVDFVKAVYLLVEQV